MKHGEFRIGGTFGAADKVGAARISAHTQSSPLGSITSMCNITPARLSADAQEFAEAKAKAWFNGPLYAVAEHVFDEDSICQLLTRTGQ